MSIFFFTENLFAAPVAGINVFVNKAKFFDSITFGLNTSLKFDSQKNSFPEQIDQFPYTDPDDDDKEERHYSKKRSSETSLDAFEFETGVYFSDILYIYGKLGTGRFYTQLNVLDERFSGLYSKPYALNITDNNPIIYGFGTTMHMFGKKVDYLFEKVDLNLDVQYRRWLIDLDDHGTNSVSYKADIDELQSCILFTGSFKDKNIFFGPRVSSITGNEGVKVGKDNFSYGGRIRTFKNLGWVFGISFLYNEFGSLILQKRIGNEEGISFEGAIKF